MHIGFDAKRAFKNFTGLGNYSRAMISILSNFYPNNEYFLYTPFYKPHPLLSFSSTPNIFIRKPEGLLKRFPTAWRRFGMTDDIRFDKIDLFHGLTAELPAGLPSKVKSVVTVHDLIFLRYPEYYKSVDRWFYTKKYKTACEHADLIIAISLQTKNDIVEFFGVDERKIRMVYQGCDEQFYHPVSTGSRNRIKQLYCLPEKYVLYVGTIESRKNLLMLVRALSHLPEDIHLVCVGRETDYAYMVKEEVAARNLTNRVAFLHQAAFPHLPAIYQHAKVFCLPSLFEGFGIPVLEALNSQVPVVTSNVSSLPEAAGQNSLFVDPLNEEEIADAIRRALNDETLRKRMIREGLAHAKLFREERIARNMWNVYKELVP